MPTPYGAVVHATGAMVACGSLGEGGRMVGVGGEDMGEGEGVALVGPGGDAAMVGVEEGAQSRGGSDSSEEMPRGASQP